MLELSSKLEYGLLALIELAKYYDCNEMVGTKEIAASQNIPDRYLDQILAELKRAGITQSYRGAKGGHRLSRSSKEITLAEIIKGLEPTKLKTEGLQISPSQKAVLTLWSTMTKEIELILSKTTLEDLCLEAQNYEQSQIMYYI